MSLLERRDLRDAFRPLGYQGYHVNGDRQQRIECEFARMSKDVAEKLSGFAQPLQTRRR